LFVTSYFLSSLSFLLGCRIIFLISFALSLFFPFLLRAELDWTRGFCRISDRNRRTRTLLIFSARKIGVQHMLRALSIL
jgi:hypothetical protein